MCLECGMLINCQKKKINVVPSKETNSLRDKVKDALEEFINGTPAIETLLFTEDEMYELKCELADTIFNALEIESADQDKIGAKVVVNPKVVIRVYRGCADVMEKEGQVDVEMRDYDTEGGDESVMDEDKDGVKYYSDTL